jgi:LPXTG-motif cell wall-anchored protein
MFPRNSSFLLGVALVAAAVIPSARADQWDKKTTITISEPVQMPSCCNAEHLVVLQPGTYVMALLDSPSDRHIVRVFEKDGTTVVTTILAIPNYRLKPTGKSAFQFWETPAGQPPAMRAWFYPGDDFGQEFAYHKTKSIEIARTAKAPVPAAVIATEAELRTAPVVVVDERGEEKPVEVLVARNDPPQSVERQESVAPGTPATLPNTGSEYPLLGLIGLGSVAVSGLISRLSRRT